MFFNDKGKDSLFDKAGVECPVFNDLDRNNRKARQAATALSMMLPAIKPTSPGNVRAIQYTTGIFQDTGGTGKYSGTSGSNNIFAATTEVNWQDGTATGFATWNR